MRMVGGDGRLRQAAWLSQNSVVKIVIIQYFLNIGALKITFE